MLNHPLFLIIDGMSQTYRAYFAIRGLATSQGLPTNAIYGLQLGSGGRNSTRFDLLEAEYMGMRQAAERLRREYVRFTGASNPATRRL